MTSTATRADVAQELFDVWHAIRGATVARFNADGLSFPRAKVLWALQHDGPMRSGAIAGYLDCSAASVTELVDALVRDGLATRAPDPRDRRASLIDLTDAGRTAADESYARKRAVLDDVFGHLDPDQVAQLKTLLDALVSSPLLQGESA